MAKKIKALELNQSMFDRYIEVGPLQIDPRSTSG
jgi:hypothetical protein